MASLSHLALYLLVRPGACRRRKHLNHSRVGSWPYRYILGQAVKACQGDKQSSLFCLSVSDEEKKNLKPFPSDLDDRRSGADLSANDDGDVNVRKSVVNIVVVVVYNVGLSSVVDFLDVVPDADADAGQRVPIDAGKAET
jgi:hypothetical protein